MNRLAPQISVPPASWKDTEGDGSRLLTTIVVDGCSLHLEALAVMHDRDLQISATREDDLAAFHAAVGADGTWETVSMNGREYVLIATPYCE